MAIIPHSIGRVSVRLDSTIIKPAVICLAALLRLGAITHDHLWYDELYTANLVKMPLGQMINTTIHDVHPPTWYFVTRAFTTILGPSDMAMRLPSAILGVVAVWLTWRLAARLFGDRVAILAAMLLAISPFAIYYSNEARMYMLLTCGVLLAAVGAVENNRWELMGGVAITMLSHNIAIVYVPAIAMVAIAWMGKRAIVPGLVGAAPWLAWLPVAITQATSLANEGYWIDNFTGAIPQAVIRHMSGVVFWMAPTWALWQSFILTVCVIVFPLAAVIAKRDKSAMTMAVMAFLPPLVEGGISLAWQPMVLARTLAGTLPVWCVLVAWWLTLPRKWAFPASAIVALGLVIMTAGVARHYSEGRNPVGEIILPWLNDRVEGKLCHADPAVAYYTRWPVSFDFDQCDTLLWLGSVQDEIPHIERVDAMILAGQLIQLEQWQLEGPRVIRLYEVKHAGAIR